MYVCAACPVVSWKREEMASSSSWPLDAVPYADVVCREYLLFRGATGALKLFDAERADEDSRARVFKVDRVMELLFQTHIPNYEAREMLEMLEFFTQRFFCRLEGLYQDTVQRLKDDTLKCYMVNAAHNNRPDKVRELLEMHAEEMVEGPRAARWREWLGLPYVRRPHAHPSFAAYFTREWHDLLLLSWRNFLGDVFAAMPLPVMLRFNTERLRRKALERENAQLRAELEKARRLQTADAAQRTSRDGAGDGSTSSSGSIRPTAAAAAAATAGGGDGGLEWPEEGTPTPGRRRIGRGARPLAAFFRPGAGGGGHDQL